MRASKIRKIPLAIRFRLSMMLLVILLSVQTQAQDSHPYVKNLKANVVGESLLVSWTTKAGFSCQDIEIQLATDTSNFITKGIYYGICGDFSEKDYSLLVDSPFLNKLNYARLDLGNFGLSYITEVFVLSISKSKVIPNPIQKNSVLHFVNTKADVVRIEIYNSQAQLQTELTTIESSYPIGELLLPQGMFICRIYRDEQLIDVLKVIR
ncbi:MAG: T9SS type A sorting domain-containing protein [Bacteroidia bacterium]